MADREHPKTHKDTGSRKQPLSPQHEGIDPLAEGDRMYPRTNTKDDGEKLARKEDREAEKLQAKDQETDLDQAAQDTLDDQQKAKAVADKKAQKAADKEIEAEGDDKTDTPAKTPAKTKASDDNPQSDGTISEESQIGNKVSSDKENTSPSNKPATK